MTNINKYHISFILYPIFTTIFNIVYQLLPHIILGSPTSELLGYIIAFVEIVFEYLEIANSIVIILFILFVIGDGVAKSYPIRSRKEILEHLGLISLFVTIGIVLFHTLMFALLFWKRVDDLTMAYTIAEYYTLYEPTGLEADVGIELSLLPNTIIEGIFTHLPDFFLIGIVFILIFIREAPDKDVNLYPNEAEKLTKDNDKNHTREDEEDSTKTTKKKTIIPTPIGLVAITLIDYLVIFWGSYKILFDNDLLRIFVSENNFLIRMLIGFSVYIIPTILSIIGYGFFLGHNTTISLPDELEEIKKHFLLVIATLAIFPITQFILFISGYPLLESTNELVTIFLNYPFLLSTETGTMMVFLIFNLLNLTFVGLHIFLSFTLVRLVDKLDTVWD